MTTSVAFILLFITGIRIMTSIMSLMVDARTSRVLQAAGRHDLPLAVDLERVDQWVIFMSVPSSVAVGIQLFPVTMSCSPSLQSQRTAR